MIADKVMSSKDKEGKVFEDDGDWEEFEKSRKKKKRGTRKKSNNWRDWVPYDDDDEENRR